MGRTEISEEKIEHHSFSPVSNDVINQPSRTQNTLKTISSVNSKNTSKWGDATLTTTSSCSSLSSVSDSEMTKKDENFDLGKPTSPIAATIEPRHSSTKVIEKPILDVKPQLSSSSSSESSISSSSESSDSDFPEVKEKDKEIVEVANFE